MESKKLQKLSMAALIISLLPLAIFISILFKIHLTNEIRSIWAGSNSIFVLVGLILSIFCVRNEQSRSIINIISTIISTLWLLMIVGIIMLTLLINFFC
ncbi:hypothetical protein [Clostridium oryzae]|uniref:Uncharacterized protein n=1 Tax=Clostridium oryzae TaxID=1450648 RepID=A0A1V4IVJ5_9CLOT|nr:hypothetical protein [Clostridium oryzae]OPJ63805.1 hypothetical protein CLORY_09890 [Clostridium oryzae]